MSKVEVDRPVAVSIVLSGVVALLTGVELMLLLPLLHVLGLPDAHPGYWPCVAVAYLGRSVVQGVCKPVDVVKK